VPSVGGHDRGHARNPVAGANSTPTFLTPLGRGPYSRELSVGFLGELSVGVLGPGGAHLLVAHRAWRSLRSDDVDRHRRPTSQVRDYPRRTAETVHPSLSAARRLHSPSGSWRECRPCNRRAALSCCGCRGWCRTGLRNLQNQSCAVNCSGSGRCELLWVGAACRINYSGSGRRAPLGRGAPDDSVLPAIRPRRRSHLRPADPLPDVS
jgi:hypothetical protein